MKVSLFVLLLTIFMVTSGNVLNDIEGRLTNGIFDLQDLSEIISENERSDFKENQNYELDVQNDPPYNSASNVPMGDQFSCLNDLFSNQKGLISYNYPQYSIGANNNNEVYILSGNIQQFKIVKALNGRPDMISFESLSKPGNYLRHRDYLGYVERSDGSPLFQNDASFGVRRDKYYSGYAAFESSNFPGHFLRHQNYRIKLHKEENTELYKMDASFLIANVVAFATFESKSYPGRFWNLNGPNGAVGITLAGAKEFQLIFPGLSGASGTVSFYAPGGSQNSLYVRHRGTDIRLEAADSVKPDQYRNDATFKYYDWDWFGRYVSFESANYPNYFIRQSGFILYIQRYTEQELYYNDVSFTMKLRV